MACLRQLHHLSPRRTVCLHARRGFAEDLDHFIAATLGKAGQVAELPFARLVGCRNGHVGFL